MTEMTIDIQNLTKQFGKLIAVDNISLKIPPGQIFGFIGENGAGKTTTIKILMGLLRATSGTARVCGLDPIEADVKVKEKIGYVSEDRAMYRWMKVKEVLWFNGNLYPNWDEQMAQQLLKDFDLDPKQKVKVLSRGMLAKLALLVAMASKPEVLILDEPSSGLDPMVRREILEKLIAYVSDYKTTIFFSSHLIDEVDRMADTVGILCKGRLLICDEKNKVKDSLKKVVLTFDSPKDSIPPHDTLLRSEKKDKDWVCYVRNQNKQWETHLKSLNPKSMETIDLSLEDVFAEYTHWEKRNR
jgi:ABC-2 type transport system ATP-binding protein